MKQLLFIVFMLPYGILMGQHVSVTAITENDPRFKDRNNIFPLIEIQNDQKVADIINKYLQKDFLYINDSAAPPLGIFDRVNPGEDDDLHPTLSNTTYEVRCNKNRIFSIAIAATSCNDNCEDIASYYTFDLKTGARIQLDALIRPEYKQKFLDTVNARKKWVLSGKIQTLTDTLKTEEPWRTDEDRAYYAEMKRLYEHCISNETNDLSSIKFYLYPGQMYVELDRCSTHATQNLDDLGSFSFSLPLAYWEKYFTDYGKQLLYDPAPTTKVQKAPLRTHRSQ